MKIMIVERHKNYGDLCRQELQDEGFDVVLYRNFSTALASLKTESPDLVICDVHVSGRQEMEACLRLLRKPMPVIIYVAGQRTSHKNIKSMANSVLVKSSDLEDLKKCIGDLMELPCGS